MTYTAVQRVLGLLLALFSVTMLPPILVSFIYGDGTWQAFGLSFLIILGFGILIWAPVRDDRREMRLRDGFTVVALFWVVLGLFGAVPLLLVDRPAMSVTDAVFESVSGLTTTGATVLSGLDGLPRGILYYRQQLQWFGGLGIIVLAVAVLPMLGVGGMQLYRAETPGPVKDNKLTPRITETAKALLQVYLGITFVCMIAYWAAGMPFFDALCHAYSTVAIGGFSTHDASIGYFDNALVDMIAVFFMFIAGVNFALHFTVARQKRLSAYLQDSEFRAYLRVLGGLTAIVLVYLYVTGYYSTFTDLLTKGLFQVVSIATTTGFTTDSFAAWPGALPVLLLLSSFVGGCAGSTAGGMKVIRWLMMYKQGLREILRLVHPNAEIPVKLGGKVVPNRVVDAVWGFFAIYIVVYGALMLFLMLFGLDQVTAFAAIAATLNNLGPGLGDVAAGFGTMAPAVKWASVCAMLLGRLEIFTLLVLFTPAFWQR
ncbi:MAG: TrkH family potassium uptake protein [Gammaproteobacteria bacterium]|nr:TrkH family potassium uptake protein [Gammaproteobacteria bacterium]MDH3506138.1 TrkH family potassium uptake protein [Gammaproteobacteria bacterium]